MVLKLGYNRQSCSREPSRQISMKNTLKSAVDELMIQQPKYAAIAQAVLSGIHVGRYPVGSMLPTEEELRSQFGVSRQTVRAALALLQDKGYVQTERPLGRRVIADTAGRKRIIRVSSIRDLVQMGQGAQQMLTLLNEVRVSSSQAEEIGCATGETWQRAELLRWASGSVAAPTMLSRFWIPIRFAQVARSIPPKRITPAVIMIDAIYQRYGEKASDANQRISAVSITGALARALQVPGRSPGLRIQRWFRNASGVLIMYSDATYNGQEYFHEATLHLES